MKLTWYGHSCFKLETAEGTIVFDPSQNGRVPGYSPLPADFPADEVICSHGHFDHNAAELVQLSGKGFGGKVTFIDSWHDDAQGAKRGENKIALVEAEGLKVAHMGDIGCELNDEQIAALKGVDVLMIPVGGFFTIDGKTARKIAEKLQPRVMLPMHYKTAWNADWPIEGPEAFLEGIPGKNVRKEIEVLRITSEDLECQPAAVLFKA